MLFLLREYYDPVSITQVQNITRIAGIIKVGGSRIRFKGRFVEGSVIG
jgi:hypothetical protein